LVLLSGGNVAAGSVKELKLFDQQSRTMSSGETPNPAAHSGRQLWWRNWITALFLFLATALVVVWQNSRLGVLWDLSGVLENSFRISLGQIPYRDFPFPHAPLTFLLQAALIKLTGRVFWHHVVYCAVVGGLATVLTWRILLNLLCGIISHAHLIAFLLSLPLIVLGIYCVFPHPFYDPDCTFAILLCILLLQRVDNKRVSLLGGLLAGATLIIPVFVKQNTGLVFLAITCLALFALMIIEVFRRRQITGYAAILAGAAGALILALLIIQLTAGLKNYLYWTIQYAASRRMPAPADMLGIYEDETLPVWIALFALGALILWLSRRGSRAWILLSALLIAAPFAWPSIYLLLEHDPSERADRLLALWPALLIVSLVIAVLTIKQRSGVSMFLPFIVISAVNGAFMSQQLWGSTYAVWPLFIILLACSIAGIALLSKQSSSWTTIPFTAAVGASLLISGGAYVWSHERLDYAKLDDGELNASTLPELKGLSTRGNWIPNFEQLVRYTDREIPRDEGILIIPGEDPFYYATGRQPRFPVLMFDHTVNPYTPAEVLEISHDLQIRWLIVKHKLQKEDDPADDDKGLLTKVLKQDFKRIKILNNYDVCRRRRP
jgi:hypothetical protein